MIDIDKVARNGRPGDCSIIYNNEDIDFRPFAFVLNVRQLVGAKRVEIAPGYVLRCAQKSEVGYIKKFLKETFGEGSSVAIWENQPTKSGKESKLPKNLWRYFVIEFGDDPNLDLLEAALAVAPVGFDIGFGQD